MKHDDPYPVQTPTRVPGDEPDDWVIRKFGLYLVVKTDGGHTFDFGIWVPANCPVPENDQDLNAKLGRLYLIELNGAFYSDTGADELMFWARGPHWNSTEVEKQAAKDWAGLERRRHSILICGAFPEAAAGWQRSGGSITLPKPGVNTLDTHDLDDIADADRSFDAFLGWKVKHDMFGTGKLVQLTLPGREAKKVAVRWRVACGNESCRNRTVIYTVSGCHHGAYCYVIDPKTGEHLADLRNQYVLCKSCSKKRRRN